MPNKSTKSAGRIKNAQINKSFKYGRKRNTIYSTLKKTRMLNGKETKQTLNMFRNNAHTSNADTKEPHSSQRELPKQSDQSAFVQNIQVPSDQDPNEPIVTISTSTMHVEKDSKDPIINYDQTLDRSKDNAHKKKNKIASDQDIENLVTYNSYTKYDRMRWYEDSKMSYGYKQFERPREAHNKRNGASKKDDDSKYKDSKAMTKNEFENNDTMAEEWLYLEPETLSRTVNGPPRISYPNRAYEEEIKIKSEITYRALLSRIQMEHDIQSRDPYDLYKLLNKRFKRAKTEDFFKDLISDIVEVLEHFSIWIAEKLSLPLPDPVDHEKLIYMREEELNYSLILTDKIKRLISRGNASNESVGFMYWDWEP